MLLGRTVAMASLAAEPSTLEMREWLADTHLLEDEENLDDEQIERVLRSSHTLPSGTAHGVM